jgi:hypothetical protein
MHSADNWTASPKTDTWRLEAEAQVAPVLRTSIGVDMGTTDTIHPMSCVAHVVSIAPTGADCKSGSSPGAAGAQNPPRDKGAKANTFGTSSLPLPLPRLLSPLVLFPPWRALLALFKPKPDDLSVHPVTTVPQNSRTPNLLDLRNSAHRTQHLVLPYSGPLVISRASELLQRAVYFGTGPAQVL